MNKAILLLCIFSLCIANAMAQEGDNVEDMTSLSLEELMDMVVISASKKEENIFEAPSNITVITDKMIKEWGMRDIKDVLRRVVGYQVIADRDEWVFAARGNVSDNNSKYLILIDGHRTNSIENFGPGQIIETPNNLSNVKRIEIIKGPGSAVWGADALAGVINIITKSFDDQGDSYANAALTLGSGKFVVGDFQVGKKFSEDVNVVVMGAFSQQDGKSIEQTAASGLSIIKPASDVGNHPSGQIQTLLDNHLPGYMLQMKAKVGQFGINAYTFETETFNRHYEHIYGRKNYLSTNKNFTELSYETSFWGGANLKARIATESNQSEYRPEVQGDSTKLPINIVWRDRGVFASVEILKQFSEKANFYSGIDYKYTKLGPNQRINAINPDASKLATTGFWFDEYNQDHQLGGYIMTDLKPADWVTLTLGSRFDYNDLRGEDKFVVNPRLAMVFKPMTNSAFKLLYNRGYLRPTNFQSASDNVSSEIMNQVDAIWMHRVGKLQYAVTGFWQKLEGFIIIANTNGGFQFSNTGDYTSTGLELELNAFLNEDINLWGNMAITDPKGENFPNGLSYNERRVDLNGNLLNYSNLTANVGGTFKFLEKKLFISPAVRYIGATTFRSIAVADAALDNQGNYNETSAFTYVDLNIGYEPNEKYGFYLYIDNLTDITTPTHMSVWNGTIEQYGRFINGKVRVHF